MRTNGTVKGKPVNNRKGRGKRRHSKRPRIGDLPMGFGKYLGRPIRRVPRSYLLWCVSEVAKIPAGDEWAIRKFLRLNSAEKKNATGSPVRPPVACLLTPRAKR